MILEKLETLLDPVSKIIDKYWFLIIIIAIPFFIYLFIRIIFL